MNAHLAATTVLYAAMLSAWAAAAALGGRDTGPLHRAGLALLQTAAIVQAALDVAAQLSGHRPAEPATHLGYVAASVVILPIALLSTVPREERGAWDAAIAAVACLAMLVVALRLQATWSQARHG